MNLIIVLYLINKMQRLHKANVCFVFRLNTFMRHSFLDSRNVVLVRKSFKITN